MSVAKLSSDLRTVCDALIAAQIAKDATRLAALLGDEYVGVDPDGRILNKAEEIENLVTSDFETGGAKYEKVIEAGETTIVVGTAKFNGPRGGAQFRFTDVLLA